jgi:hypothetical protein
MKSDPEDGIPFEVVKAQRLARLKAEKAAKKVAKK